MTMEKFFILKEVSKKVSEVFDKELEKNENIVNNLRKEFYNLFIERLDMPNFVWEIFYQFYVDGRSYYERIIDSRHPKNGLVGIKRLPSETMDYIYDPLSAKVLLYLQYLLCVFIISSHNVKKLQ